MVEKQKRTAWDNKLLGQKNRNELQLELSHQLVS